MIISKIIQIRIVYYSTLLLIFGFGSQVSATENLLPKPREIERMNGSFTISSKTTIFYSWENDEDVKFIIENFQNIVNEEYQLRTQAMVKNNSRTLSLRTNQIMLIHRYINNFRLKLLKTKTEAFIISSTGDRINPHSISRLINEVNPKNKRITPIKIRQSVIANLLKTGNELRIVQVFAGHKRASSTEAYKQTGLEELKTAITKLHPLQ